MSDLGRSEASSRSAQFRKEREASWFALEALVERAEKRGLRQMSYEDAQALSSRYKEAVNALSVARAISLDKALLAYLDALCARAYLVVYAPQESLTQAIGHLFAHGIPNAARRSARIFLVAVAVMALGALCGILLCAQDPAWFFTFVPQSMAGQRIPGASAETLRGFIFSDYRHNMDSLRLFSAYLFSHNTQIAIMIFALGVFAAVPSIILQFYNGIILGLMIAVHIQAGLAYDFIGWLTIHGVTELGAVCVACTAAIRLGMAVLLPGQQTRRDALRDVGPDATKLLILSAIMLVAAALIEGFLRQLVQSTPTRMIIGWGIGALWLTWLSLAGRGGGDDLGH